MQKIVTFSFDDGVTQDRKLISLLKKYGLKCTFNLNSKLLGSKGALSKIAPDDVKEVYAGFEVASHTCTHPLLTQCSPARIAEEVIGDYLRLSELVGYPVRGFAYPGGRPNCDRLVTEVLRVCTSLVYARTNISTYELSFPRDLLQWDPTLHILDPRTDELIDRFDVAKEDCLLYIWGHSFELDRPGGWERAEAVFARIASLHGVTCMTNMEVCDWMKELRPPRVNCVRRAKSREFKAEF